MTNKSTPYRRIASLKNSGEFKTYIEHLGIDLPFDEELENPGQSSLGQPYKMQNGFTIGNRFCILPMEGWDGTTTGKPSQETTRRWQRFGLSGAKLIWGGEAVAVRHDGRANPNQLLINETNIDALRTLREELIAHHALNTGRTEDLLIGLQLTHSGRFARPDSDKQLKPRTLYKHPLLDTKFNIDSAKALLSDEEIEQIIADFIKAARLSYDAGFHFVDIKHCHGYLGHEFLSAFDRPGPYGGSFENRTRFLREVVSGIRRTVPELQIGVRLSAFDWIPFTPGEGNVGQPAFFDNYSYAFGGTDATGIDLTEPLAFLRLLESLGIELVCITAGSPYYNPHIQRPALFPPSDGYLPPEDPLVGVSRQLNVTAKLKQAFPNLCIVGSAYSYLQDYLPNVAQSVIRNGMADFVGLGRTVLSYPEMPLDILKGKQLNRKAICRTFSDCTTAPRQGMISGCYPLDDFYGKKPEAEKLKQYKKDNRS
ncbi:NADH:flavin oxidoreductase [candidate division KSB1 bacterium]|nr:NADH:flavin oxidoreductase [candidate division KSB1 bacterium]